MIFITLNIYKHLFTIYLQRCDDDLIKTMQIIDIYLSQNFQNGIFIKALSLPKLEIIL